MNASAKISPWKWGFILGITLLLPLVLYWPAFRELPISAPPPVQNISFLAQAMVVVTAFGAKPAYMLLSLIWIIWLWRRAETDLTALRWGLIFFLAGETACAINYLGFHGNSAGVDYLHSYGMAVGFAFVAYAVLEALDLRLVKYSAENDRCAALTLCRACVKYSQVPCGLRRLFSFALPALTIIAFIPLCVDLVPASQRSPILGSIQTFEYPLWAQLFENRYCSVAAILLLAGSWVVLSFRQADAVPLAKLFLAAALGPLGFGLMRLFLRTAFHQNLAWANTWEELTELLFVAGVGLVLWTFRNACFRDQAAAPSNSEAASIHSA
jgi:hypothetical protein